MSLTRSRVVRSFSFRPEDIELLHEVRGRVTKYLPEVNDSELVRLALEVLQIVPETLLRNAVSTFERMERGRPPGEEPISEHNLWDTALEEEDKGRLRRFALFEELETLREGPRGEKEVEARIEMLSQYFGMIYSPPE